MEAMGVESKTSFKTLKNDTPLPRGNVSNETMELLKQASSKLDRPDRGIKKLRDDSTEGDTRMNYPTQNKNLYLKTKTLLKRKLISSKPSPHQRGSEK